MSVKEETMYRYFAILIVAVCCYSCSGQSQSVQLSHNLPENVKTIYILELSDDKFTLTQETEFTVALIVKDTLVVDANVRKTDYKDGSSNEQEIRSGYAQYENRPLYFKMNKQGAILMGLTSKSSEGDATAAFDVQFYYLFYPTEQLSIGSKWTQNRETADMVFHTISTEYELKEIHADDVVIHVSNEFQGDNELFTKNISGDYVVDRKTGAVLRAKLTISGFNGFRQSNGEMVVARGD